MSTLDSTTSVFEGLSVFHPPALGHVFEVRIPVARGCTHAGYFEDLDRAATAIETAAKYQRSIYVTLNPVLPALLARAKNRIITRASLLTSDEQIVRRCRLLIDCDATRPAGVSATLVELQLALERRDKVVGWLAQEHGWPEPTLIMSGNGGHAIYALDLAVGAPADVLVRQTLRALALKYSDEAVSIDTTVGNASRISKVPGTFSRKGDSTSDRPHRRAQIETVPATCVLVTIEQLQAVAALAPPDRHSHRGAPRVRRPAAAPTDRDRLLTRARAYLGKIEGAIAGQGGDRHTYVVACRLVRDFGLGRGDALTLLSEWNRTCAPPWSDCELEDKIDRALQYGDGPIGAKANEGSGSAVETTT